MFHKIYCYLYHDPRLCTPFILPDEVTFAIIDFNDPWLQTELFNNPDFTKSQLNNLSKRQILESLMYEQNQSNATLSRLITAVARTAQLDPEQLAQYFIDDKANQEYINKFNNTVKAKHEQSQNDQLTQSDQNHGPTSAAT